MTHSLHRRGAREDLGEDFVVIGCPATGVNKEGSASKTQKFLSMCHKHGPINLGDMKTGNIYNTSMANILDNVTDGTIVECTFDNREKIVSLLKEFKNDKPGISITISGVADVVQECMYDAGLGRVHSIEFSLGTWGRSERLPEYELLRITTMCGHAMIAAGLVDKMVRDIKRGRKALDEAVMQIAKCCTCGNVNLTRAKKLLQEMLPTYMCKRY